MRLQDQPPVPSTFLSTGILQAQWEMELSRLPAFCPDLAREYLLLYGAERLVSPKVSIRKSLTRRNVEY